MTTRFARLTIAVAAVATLVSPAAAQGITIGPNGIQVEELRGNSRDGDDAVVDRRDDNRRGGDSREITEREAIRIAKGEGLRDVDDISRTRSTYTLDGSDRRGRDITVVIDRRSGEVISAD
jgi:uncharacterized membrane protein YkoI